MCVGDTVTGEGCFVHTVRKIDWKEGHNYRALLQLSNPPDGSNSRIMFWMQDLETGAWTLLAEYDLGYNGNHIYWCCSFLEDFSIGGAGSVRSAALSNYRAHPAGQAEWVSTRKATFSCNYSNGGSYWYGAKGNAFFTITTGLPGRCATPQDPLTVTVNHSEAGSPY